VTVLFFMSQNLLCVQPVETFPVLRYIFSSIFNLQTSFSSNIFDNSSSATWTCESRL